MTESVYQETDVVPAPSEAGSVKPELPVAGSGDDSISAVSAPVPHPILRPGSAWKLVDLAEVWYFRDLLFSLAGRDLKLRYKQTILGVAWVILQPLLASLIFTFVFGILGGMAKGHPHYFAIAFAGQMGWYLFANIISRSSTCMVANTNLVSKVYFPRIILPVSASFSVLVDFACSFAVMIILLLIYRINPGVAIVLIPVWMLILMGTALGLGMIAASLAVSFRDIQYILPIFMQMLMYASPVGYPLSVVTEKLHKHHPILAQWYPVNPLVGVLSAFRYSLLGAGRLPIIPLAWSAAFGAIMFVIGLFTFKRLESRFADVI